MGTIPARPAAINDRQDCNGWLYGSYSARSLASDSERTINLYLEQVQSGSGKSRATLYATPGLTPLLNASTGIGVTLPGGPCIGIYSCTVNNVDHVVAVSGNQLYEVFSNGTYTLIGTLALDGSGYISFSSNKFGVIAIATGAGLYMYNSAVGGSASLTTIYTVNGTALTPSSICFIDGTFYALTIANQQINNCVTDSPYIWNDLDYFIADGASGQVVAIAADHLQLWVMSTLNGEVYFDAGNPSPGSPLSRVSGGLVQYGTIPLTHLLNIQDGLFWLGRTPGGGITAYRNSGYSATRISDHAVESAWNDYPYGGTVYTSYYFLEGHEFFRVDFPLADNGNGHTWIYDTATGVWHERLYWNATQGAWYANPARFICYAWGQYIAADYTSGNIYIQSLNALTDNGNLIRRRRTGSPLARQMDWNQFHEFQLDLQMGIGVPATGQGSNPLAVLRFSDDGGYTWSNEITCPLGREGNTKARAIWRRLGKSRDRVFEVTITDPIQIAIINAYVRISPGSGA